MSHVAIITTYKKVEHYIDERVALEKNILLEKRIFKNLKEEFMYLVLVNNEFYPPYYPTKRGKLWKDKHLFIDTLRKINDKYLIKKLLFVFLEDEESIDKICVCDFDDLLELFNRDEIEANTLYKVNHNYFEYQM